MGAVLPEFMPEMSHDSPVIALFFKTIALQEVSCFGREEFHIKQTSLV